MAKSKTNGAKTSAKANGNGHAASASARSAKQGGSVPAERYAKDSKSVVKRLHEKALAGGTQAANAYVRAEAAGDKSPHTAKLKKAVTGFENIAKMLA